MKYLTALFLLAEKDTEYIDFTQNKTHSELDHQNSRFQESIILIPNSL